MGARLNLAMEQGCIGLSTGLAYPPAIRAPTEEVIALAHHAAAHRGLYVTHMRNEREGLLDSVTETLRIGCEAQIPVVISHHKCTGRENWGMSKESLALIAQARKTQSVNLDVYPYIASSTVLLADWVPAAEKVLVTWSVPHPELNGKDLADICAQWDVDTNEAVDRLSPAGAIYFQMDEEDLQRIMAFDDAMIGSDGLPHDEVPHPRLWGTFPKVLGHYSRERKLFELEEAVHRMSGVTARVFGFADRGEIARSSATPSKWLPVLSASGSRVWKVTQMGK
jgi:N-acyl-D-amino-acid deacylase